jgi:hypothetical protein
VCGPRVRCLPTCKVGSTSPGRSAAVLGAAGLGNGTNAIPVLKGPFIHVEPFTLQMDTSVPLRHNVLGV